MARGRLVRFRGSGVGDVYRTGACLNGPWESGVSGRIQVVVGIWSAVFVEVGFAVFHGRVLRWWPPVLLGSVGVGTLRWGWPGVEPSLPEPDAGVLSSGHLAKGWMSIACVEFESSEGMGELAGEDDGEEEGVGVGVGEGSAWRAGLLISSKVVSKRALISLFSRMMRMRASPVLSVRGRRSLRMVSVMDVMSEWKRKFSSCSAARSLAMHWNSAASQLHACEER